MKDFLGLAIAAALFGFVCFAFMYWIVDNDFESSFTTGISVGISGFIVEYFMIRKQKARVK